MNNTRFLDDLCQQVGITLKSGKNWFRNVPADMVVDKKEYELNQHGINYFLYRFGSSETWAVAQEKDDTQQLLLVASANSKRYEANWHRAEAQLEEEQVRHEDDLGYHRRIKERMKEERDEARRCERVMRDECERLTSDLITSVHFSAELKGGSAWEVVRDMGLSEDSIDLF